MTITIADYFCGAGGSSTGLAAAGLDVAVALNHDEKALATHEANHPKTRHMHVDLYKYDPRCVPHTDVAWLSPSCTPYSPAGGRKRKNKNQLHLWEPPPKPDPTLERSRLTAWSCIDYVQYHRYAIGIIENVCEFALDQREMFPVFLDAFRALKYEVQVVCFNSQFAYPVPTPQSRDRLFIVLSRKGLPKPNVGFTPPGFCSYCEEEVRCMQTWKACAKKQFIAGFFIGKYGKHGQYFYSCPRCKQEVVPYRNPARLAIDWSIRSVRICDRKKHKLPQLKATTLARIEAGLKRFTVPFLAHSAHTNDKTGRVYSIQSPSPALTTKREMGLVVPPFIDVARNGNRATSINEPVSTVSTINHHALVEPPESPEFLATYHGGRHAVSSIDTPSPTVATNKQIALVQPEIDAPDPFLSIYYGNGSNTSLNEPAPTLRTKQSHALIEPDWSALVEQCRYRMLNANEAKLLMGFPREYRVLGNTEDQFKQIGNAVDPRVSAMFRRCLVGQF